MNRPSAAAVVLALCSAYAGGAAAQTHTDPPLRLMLFGDASYLATERDVADGFSLGQLVGHLSAGLSERVTVFAEPTLTSRPTGTIATLERLIVRYDFSDGFKLSAGRYHTPISWWNTQYHHGLWLQTSIDRPRLVRFGTPLIPVHFMGLLAEGSLPVGRSTLVYEAGVGNGRQEDLVAPGDAGDDNGHRAFVAGVRVRPGFLHRVELGVHGFLDRVDPGTGPVDERIVGGHVVWLANPEIVAEYLHFIHDPRTAGAQTVGSDGYYAQVAWRLPGARALQPYARYEATDIGAGDPLFTGLGLDYDGVIGGLRWDFAEFAALKGEVRSESFAGADRATSLVLNAAFVVPNLIE